jgi:hypothetical protein
MDGPMGLQLRLGMAITFCFVRQILNTTTSCIMVRREYSIRDLYELRNYRSYMYEYMTLLIWAKKI